jgi:hypothetical protein
VVCVDALDVRRYVRRPVLHRNTRERGRQRP